MLICFLSLGCDFQLYFLKGELTADPEILGPFDPKPTLALLMTRFAIPGGV